MCECEWLAAREKGKRRVASNHRRGPTTLQPPERGRPRQRAGKPPQPNLRPLMHPSAGVGSCPLNPPIAWVGLPLHMDASIIITAVSFLLCVPGKWPRRPPKPKEAELTAWLAAAVLLGWERRTVWGVGQAEMSPIKRGATGQQAGPSVGDSSSVACFGLCDLMRSADHNVRTADAFLGPREAGCLGPIVKGSASAFGRAAWRTHGTHACLLLIASRGGSSLIACSLLADGGVLCACGAIRAAGF